MKQIELPSSAAVEQNISRMQVIVDGLQQVMEVSFSADGLMQTACFEVDAEDITKLSEGGVIVVTWATAADNPLISAHVAQSEAQEAVTEFVQDELF